MCLRVAGGVVHVRVMFIMMIALSNYGISGMVAVVSVDDMLNWVKLEHPDARVRPDKEGNMFLHFGRIHRRTIAMFRSDDAERLKELADLYGPKD